MDFHASLRENSRLTERNRLQRPRLVGLEPSAEGRSQIRVTDTLEPGIKRNTLFVGKRFSLDGVRILAAQRGHNRDFAIAILVHRFESVPRRQSDHRRSGDNIHHVFDLLAGRELARRRAAQNVGEFGISENLVVGLVHIGLGSDRCADFCREKLRGGLPCRLHRRIECRGARGEVGRVAGRLGDRRGRDHEQRH